MLGIDPPGMIWQEPAVDEVPAGLSDSFWTLQMPIGLPGGYTMGLVWC